MKNPVMRPNAVNDIDSVRSKRYVPDMNYKIVIHQEPEGGFWAEAPTLPGCVSQGDTREELKANMREAIEGYLIVLHSLVLGLEFRMPVNGLEVTAGLGIP